MLYLAGFDLRDLDLLARKAMLQSILPTVGPLRFSEHVAAEGEAMFAQVERMGLEGIVAKRGSSRYVSKRSRDWIKINAAKSDDFVLAGYARPRDGGNGFAALLLAQYRGGELVFAGRVGTGFNRADARTLGALLDTLEPAPPPAGAPQEKGLVWVAEGPIAQVKFKERTADGLLRQPVYLAGSRRQACGGVRLARRRGRASRDGRRSRARRRPCESVRRRLRLSISRMSTRFSGRPKSYTKGDLIEYYRAISPWLLPYLRDRPVVLTRYPDGIDGKSFFQKDAPVYAPEWLRLSTMWSEQAQREIHYFVLDDVPSLLYVANMGSIPLHVWSSRIAALERPDWCILDLDPKGAPFDPRREDRARICTRSATRSGCRPIAKTSGSTGLHVLIPLGGALHLRAVATLGELLGARSSAKSLPDIATIVRAVGDARRQGLFRLSAERPRQAARRAVQRASAAGSAGVDAAQVVAGDVAAAAFAVQRSDRAATVERAWRPARADIERLDRHAKGDRAIAGAARRALMAAELERGGSYFTRPAPGGPCARRLSHTTTPIVAVLQMSPAHPHSHLGNCG